MLNSPSPSSPSPSPSPLSLSLLSTADPNIYQLKAGPVQWPDPPVLKTLWRVQKNYILKPAMSTLAGFLIEGPAGAAVAGATHVAHQIVTDLANSDQEPKARAAVTAVEKAAKRTLGLPLTQLNPETSKTTVVPYKKELMMEENPSNSLEHSKIPMSIDTTTPKLSVPAPPTIKQIPDESLVNE